MLVRNLSANPSFFRHLFAQLKSMDMDVCDAPSAESVGHALAKYLKKEVNGKDVLDCPDRSHGKAAVDAAGGRRWHDNGKRHRSHRDYVESDYHNSSPYYSNSSRNNSYRNGSESSRYTATSRLSIQEGDIPDDRGFSFNAQEEHEIADLKKKVIDLNKQVVDLTAKVVHLESKEEG